MKLWKISVHIFLYIAHRKIIIGIPLISLYNVMTYICWIMYFYGPVGWYGSVDVIPLVEMGLGAACIATGLGLLI